MQLPSIASEELQEQFIALCSGMGVTPRQALLLAHIWQARAEHQARQVQESMLGIIEFSPDVLPCEGQCPHHKISVAPARKE